MLLKEFFVVFPANRKHKCIHTRIDVQNQPGRRFIRYEYFITMKGYIGFNFSRVPNVD